MAKNSDKRTLLHRRLQELRHALEHGLDAAQIHKRADRLRAAVLAVLKKQRSRSGAPYSEPADIEEEWATLPTDQVIERSRPWPLDPTPTQLRQR